MSLVSELKDHFSVNTILDWKGVRENIQVFGDLSYIRKEGRN